MLLHSRSVFAVAILLLSLMPAWSKTERVVFRGNTFVFEIPDNLKPDQFNHQGGYDHWTGRPSDDLLLYQGDSIDDPTVVTFAYEADRFDLRRYVLDAGPIERSNAVSIVRSTTSVEMAASTSSCGGKCFVVVKVSDPGGSERSQTEALFKRYVRALDTRSFEPDKPVQAVIPKDPSESRRTEASRESPVTHDQGHWFVIAGAWPQSESYKVKARIALLSGNNIAAKVINTDQYANLAPGLRAVVLGPASREQAEVQLATIKSIVPDAYIKEGF